MVPNLHGISDNRKLFNGVTIKLRQGTADGQVIMHCTSLSNYLDGPKGNIFDKEQVTICTVHSQWQRNAMLVLRRRFLQEPWDLMPLQMPVLWWRREMCVLMRWLLTFSRHPLTLVLKMLIQIVPHHQRMGTQSLGSISIAGGLITGISSKNRDRGLVVADPLCNNQSTSV